MTRIFLKLFLKVVYFQSWHEMGLKYYFRIKQK